MYNDEQQLLLLIYSKRALLWGILFPVLVSLCNISIACYGSSFRMILILGQSINPIKMSKHIDI